MSRLRSTCAMAALAALLATSAAAQPPPAVGAGEAKSPTSRSTVPMGSLQREQNAWRGRALIGTAVFNGTGQRIATIDDLLIADSGAVDRVVLSVAQSRKLVAIPFAQLRFVPSESLGTPLGPRGHRMSRVLSVDRTGLGPYGVMLPDSSRDALAGMEAFRRTPSL